MNEWERAALDSAKSRAKAIKDTTIADIEEKKREDQDSSNISRKTKAPVAPPVKPLAKKKAKTPLVSSPTTPSANGEEEELASDNGLLCFFGARAL